MTGWDAAYLAATPVVFSQVFYKRWRHGKYRRSLPGMMGANLPRVPLPPHRERLWLHSVSVGETVGAGAVFKLLREARPDWQFLSTTTTETGQDQAHRSLGAANWHDFAPADFSWKVRGFLNAYRPSAYLVFETELWPNTLLECARRRLPVYLINAKLSDRSARRYESAKALLRGPFSAFRAVFAQTPADAERFRRLLPAGTPIHVTGNVKFDSLPKPLSLDERESLRSEWGIAPTDLLILAGSTHPGEEDSIAEAFEVARRKVPNLRLAIAPRHPERFNAVAYALEARGLSVHRASEGDAPEGGADVLLLDKMGVLARSFGAADMALVGGAWNPIGGHNLLEPAAHGIPVLHGPHMHAQRDIMRIMREANASSEVVADSLADELVTLAGNSSARRAAGDRAIQAARANQGAAHRTVELLLPLFS